jgi:hypothetical protein
MQKKFRTQFFIVKCLIIAKSKTPIQLCMFYNQKNPKTKWVFGCRPMFGDGLLYLSLFFFDWAFFLALDVSLLTFFSHLKWILDVNIQYLYEYVISINMIFYIHVHT